MDWSLVLASQGIEPWIGHAEDGAWELIVPEHQFEQAEAAIRQYRRENLRWGWRRELPRSELVFDWAALAWVSVTVLFHALATRQPQMRMAGLLDGQEVADGEWWRLFTATLLHDDVAHLATNAVFGLLLLGLAMGRYGTGVGMLAACLAGGFGNWCTYWIHGEFHRSLGASGVVMGALGLLAAQSFELIRHRPHPVRTILGGVAGGVMIFVLLGFSPSSDVVAHSGGFVGGLLLGGLLGLAGRKILLPGLNLAALALLAIAILTTWMLALRGGG